jgi:ferric-dicitrate binding protein FerR (iron transport regulator)
MNENNNISDSIKECIVAYLQGDITPKQREMFQEWLHADETNKLFFNQLQMIWNLAATSGTRHFDIDEAWKEVKSRMIQPGLHREHERSLSRRLSRKLKPAMKIAAMFAIAYTLGVATTRLTGKPADHSGQYLEMTAPKGSRAFVTLDDGTKVWLNAGTQLRYPKNYGQKQRNVTLTGEAYFEVAKNPEIPFIVNANGIHITALGTAFNVKAYAEDGQVETTLTEGTVRLEAADAKIAMKPIILHPNQKVVVRTDDAIPEKSVEKEETARPDSAVSDTKQKSVSGESVSSVVQLADTRPYVSWKDTKWMFKHQNLVELAVKLERRYDVTFVFEDEQLRDYVVSGTLLDETLEQVMKTLRLTVPIDFQINHKTVILKENAALKKKYQALTQ